MEIEEFVDRVSQFLPFEIALEVDRIGIQVKTNRKSVSKVLVTYEVAFDVIEEAKKINAELIISFHPLIYSPLERITFDDRVGGLVFELVKNSISLVVLHTNFDAFRGGTSWLFAEKLGLCNIDFLVLNEKDPNYGFGVIGELQFPIEVTQFLKKLQKVTNSPLRWCQGRSDFVKKVALVGGSGMSFVQNAFDAGVDAFITADIKYHNFHEYNGRMALIDPGHWEMEYLVSVGLKNLLEREFKEELKFFVSNCYTNPIKYYPNEEYNKIQRELLVNIKG